MLIKETPSNQKSSFRCDSAFDTKQDRNDIWTKQLPLKFTKSERYQAENPIFYTKAILTVIFNFVSQGLKGFSDHWAPISFPLSSFFPMAS